MKKHVVDTVDMILTQNGYSVEDYFEEKGFKASAKAGARLLTVRQAANYLACSTRSVYTLLKAGTLKSRRGIVGIRIAIEDLEELIEASSDV